MQTTALSNTISRLHVHVPPVCQTRLSLLSSSFDEQNYFILFLFLELGMNVWVLNLCVPWPLAAELENLSTDRVSIV